MHRYAEDEYACDLLGTILYLSENTPYFTGINFYLKEKIFRYLEPIFVNSRVVSMNIWSVRVCMCVCVCVLSLFRNGSLLQRNDLLPQGRDLLPQRQNSLPLCRDS